MVAVVVERNYTRPLTLEVLAESSRRAGSCLELHNVRPLFQSLAEDGLSSLCVYDAPDAEALRRISEQIGADPPPKFWAADTFCDPEHADAAPRLQPGENTLGIVDRTFVQPKDFSELQAIEDAASSCLLLHQVRYLCSYFSHDRLRMACVYAAPDLEAIRQTSRQVDLPFDNVRRAVLHSVK